MSTSTLLRDTEATDLAIRLASDGANPVQVAGALIRRMGMSSAEAVAFCNRLEEQLAAADLDGQCALFETLGAMIRGERDQKAITAVIEALRARCGWQLDADKRKALAEGSSKRWKTLRVVGG